MEQQREHKVSALSFADVFAGCGGLSLGLTTAGWKGRFAIEKSSDAFDTLKTNLVVGSGERFDWPEWFPQEATTTSDFLKTHGEKLRQLHGQIDLLAGGPPCQGFSFAGRRTHSDPRNALTEDYLQIVEKLEPRFLLIENVRGFTVPFKKHADADCDDKPYSERVISRIKELGYMTYSKLVDLSSYGVPQSRKRFIIIAIRNGDTAKARLGGQSPFDLLESKREHFLASKGLPHSRPISVSEAIGDLVVRGQELVDCLDSSIKGYKQVKLPKQNPLSPFIKLMRKDVEGTPDSLRLPKHSAKTIEQFVKISAIGQRGKTLDDDSRKLLGIKKHAITPLDAAQPSATITTLPDDIIHYSEPRILTVRENARIQTFPDWYRFKGNYTTGGIKRKNQCPRYTQVGNAVPPLFAEAMGRLLLDLAS